MNQEIKDVRLKQIIVVTILFMAIAFFVLAIAVSPLRLDVKFALTGLLLICVAAIYGLAFLLEDAET